MQKKRRLRVNKKLWLALAIALCFALFGKSRVYFTDQVFQPFFTSLWSWNFSKFDFSSLDHALTEKERENFISFFSFNAKKSLKEVKEIGLAFFAGSELSSLQFIQIPNRDGLIKIVTKNRDKVLKIQADQLRYIASDGTIYGQAESTANLPVLDGLFDTTDAFFFFAEENRLVPEEGKEIVIEEALRLLDLLTRENYLVPNIHFDPNTGFNALLKNSIAVNFGRAPFATKIKRLKFILNKPDSSIDAIDLDYEGKAFLSKKPNEKDPRV